ncbi:MAG: YjbH domain-containing protein [Massilia sp.]
MIFAHPLKRGLVGCALLSAAHAFGATPTLNGQSGYINMPSAEVEKDGTFTIGYSHDQPYGAISATSTILPFLQFTGRYVSISGIRGFDSPDGYGSNYGRFKDKVADAKLRLWEESLWMPSVAVGATDLLGTELFKGQYVVATKHFGAARNIEATLGYGHKRPDGAFAGVRWAPLATPGWAFVAEYDANDYPRDFRASETDAGKRSKGAAVAVEYRWGWLGAQLARHRDHFSANAYVTIPFGEREYIPKIFEPAPYQPKNAPPRVSAAAWQADSGHGAALIAALVKQDYRNVRVQLDGNTLHLTLTNTRIYDLGRSMGRAARTALAFAPEGTRALRITYTRLEQPVATYEFFDLARLSDYLSGLVGRETFLQSVLIRYARPDEQLAGDQTTLLAGLQEAKGEGEGGLEVQTNRDGNIVQLSAEDREANRFKVVPRFGFFFNDPSGALRYEVAAAANYDRRLGTGLYLNSAFKLNIFENISGVTQASNSDLPHVRTDVAEYKRAGRFKLNKLMVNQYLMPDERLYARLSAGIYEEMFSGVGGQLLYLPKDSRWVADLSVDALRQRGYRGWFDMRDYRTVTALGALHYKLPYDITATARVGRFLAKDNGVRFEFKRRFQSGIEVGAWYARTDGKDITNPGTPTNPYHDKGVFLSIPLRSMLPSDTQANAGLALSPWTRDVGQMVATPGDLYEMLENPRRDMTRGDALGNFAERADEQGLASVNPPVKPLTNPWPAFRARIEQSSSTLPRLPEWAPAAGIAAGVVLASAALDKPVDKYMQRHADARLTRTAGNFGKSMPVALIGLAGAAFALGDERMQNIGLISLESVAGALGLSGLGKYAVGRARPGEGRGPWSQVGPDQPRSNASFPSAHSAAAFAAVTPFAEEYDAPWLYGLAAVSSMGRVAGRQHWVSDTVAGGLIGYAVGGWLWHAQRDNSASRVTVVPGPRQLGVAWQGSY